MTKERKPIPNSKANLQAIVPFVKLGNSIGAGGNGIVYTAVDNSDGSKIAIKFLLNVDPKRFTRFVDEVLVVTTILQGNEHVVPILSSKLELSASPESMPWYTMPIAVTLRAHVRDMSWADRLGILADLALGLDSLHALDVAHRDLKPENMLFLNGRPRFGDFGIAKFPESAAVTTPTEPMGPAGYIAPEMLVNATLADAQKADVYSFGKSIWSLLTGEKMPFVGQYTSHHTAALSHYSAPNFVHESLDGLLRESTDPNPSLRPSAAIIASRLRSVVDQQENFEAANSAQWIAAEQETLVLPGLVRARWEGIAAIAAVTNLLSRRGSLNHCFFPDGGGQDVSDAQACEGGRMLSLGSFGVYYVVNAKSLTLERFPGHANLSYAVLETADTQPLGVQARTEYTEELLQLENGWDYVPWVEDQTEDRFVTKRCFRYHKGGRFILAPKAGAYNQLDNYTGQSNRLEADQLRSIFYELAQTQIEPKEASAFDRVPTLHASATLGVPEFLLRYLSEDDLQKLLDLEDALTIFPGVLAAEMDARESQDLNPPKVPRNPDGLRSAERFIDSLTNEQVREYLGLMYLGRGDLPIYQYADHLESTSDYRHHVNYLRGLLGNGYLRRALNKFGLMKSGTRDPD
jgi:hypothetical protein